MASDFSSECTEAMAILDEEKEEGEISLDDVSSSEEGHIIYRTREKCRGCSQAKQCTSCCPFAARYARSKHLHKKDAEKGKENHHLINESGYSVDRHTNSTLQEKNDDLIPISSDSDMELVGLTKRTHRVKSSKLKKKKKKRRPHTIVLEKEDELDSSEVSESVTLLKRGTVVPSKENRLLKTHHREKSPIIYKMRPSPRRHRSPIRIRPVTKTVPRKHSKKVKSPDQSLHKVLANPLHKKIRKHPSSVTNVPSPSCDGRVTRLLKKVRQLEMVGTLDSTALNKTKEHGSSLKDKLNNILKPASVNNEETTNSEIKVPSPNKPENGEDEEDLNILRQKALETKQNKMHKSQEPLNVEADIQGNCVNEDEEDNDNDDDDDEDLKLRLIALQSAVYKKYRNRAAKLKKNKKALSSRAESPFSESFLNDISLADDVEEKPPDSSELSEETSAKDCNNSIEDMELDSEEERVNSDDAPYSPTDTVNNELVLEAEQLGMDTTDVSLININSKNFVKYNSYLPNNAREKGSISTGSVHSEPDFRAFLRDSHDRSFNPERPYSPSDAPIFDPDLTDSLLPQNETLNNTLSDSVNFPNSSNFYSNNQQSEKEAEVEFVDDLLETDIDGSPLVPMEKDTSAHYHIPEHLSYQMLHPSYHPLYLNNMHEDIRIPTIINQPLAPQSVLRVAQQLQQEPKKCSKETPGKRVRKKSLITPGSEFSNLSQHFQFDLTVNEQVDIQQTKENVSVNYEDDLHKGKKKGKRKKKKSKRSLSEIDKVNEANQNVSQVSISEDETNSAKRLKTSIQDSSCIEANSKDLSELRDETGGVNELRDNRKEGNEENESREKSRERNEDKSKKVELLSDEINSEIHKDTEKEIEKTQQIEPRRKSVDEDEEALRAILLASMGKRTKSPKTDKSSIQETREGARENSLPPASKRSTEILSNKSVDSGIKVTPTNVTTAKVLPSNVTPAKVSSLKVSPSKIKPSQAPISKAIPSPVLPSKAPLVQIPPSKTTPLKVQPPKVTPSKTPSTKLIINSSATLNPVLGKRKANSVLLSGSSRKLVKRTVIPASTKVVNNAKRYQNSLLQKKLNLQKAITAFNAKKVIANKSLRVLNLNQNTRSISPSIPPSNQTERFIISLNSDTDSDSESERRNTIVAVRNNRSVEKPLTIPTTEFERSVDQFLRDVRKKQESSAAGNKPTNSNLAKIMPPSETSNKGKDVTLPAIPLAVRHLPASQQEEYHRLKQQIIEREKMKLQRSSVSQQISNASTVPPDPLSPMGTTTCSNSKATTTNNVSKPSPVTKILQNDNPPSKNVPNPSIACQGKTNFRIQIKNTPPRKSPVENLSASNSSGNTQEKVKPFPKIKILTCEQINKKLLQIQVSQKDEGRKVTMSDLVSPIKEINVSFPNLRNENNAGSEISTKESNDNSVNTNENDLDASVIILSDSRDKDKTCTSQDSQVNNDCKIRRVSESSTVALAKNNTGLSSDNSTTISAARQNTTIGEKEKRGEKEEAAMEKVSKNISTKSKVVKESDISTQSIVDQQATGVKESVSKGKIDKQTNKKSTTAKESTVCKQPTTEKESNVSKQPTTGKEATIFKAASGKESNVSKQSTTGKEAAISKVTLAKESNVSEQSTSGKEAAISKATVANESNISKQPTSGKETTISKATIGNESNIPKQPTSGKETTISKTTAAKESNVSKQLTSVKEAAISKKSTSGKEATISKQSTFGKEAAVSKQSTSGKEATISKQSTSGKEATISKQSTSGKETTISKQPTSGKEATISKTIATKESTVSKQPTSGKESKFVKNPVATGKPVIREQPMIDLNSGSKGTKENSTAESQLKKANKSNSEPNEEELKRKLVETEQELVKKRYVVLDDLAEVSNSLRQWELEKDLQSSLSDEVKKLRIQLKETEDVLQEQKEKVASMGSKVSACHEKMNNGRKECFRLSKICTGLGSRIFGRKYKVPETGVQLVNNRLKEVAQHTSELCKKKIEKKRRRSLTSDSSRRESDTASINSEKSTGQLRRNVSRESICSYDKDSVSGSQASSEIVDQIEADKDNLSVNETESVETQSPCTNFCSSTGDNDFQLRGKRNPENVETEASINENIDSARKGNSKSANVCHNLDNSVQNNINSAENQSKKTPIRPYVSILDHMKTASNSLSDGILCPYQLMGSCQDAECQFLHHSSSHRG